MNNRKDKDKRNIIVIDKAFQFRYFIRILLGSILISFFLSLLVWWWNVNYVRQILTEFEIYEESLQAILFKETMPSIFSLALVIIAISFLFGTYELYISHKIAGPLFRFKKLMKMVEDGSYNMNLSFRKKDELKDIAAGFNSMLSSILNREKEEIKKIKDLEMRLDSLIREFENGLLSNRCQDLKLDLEQLRKRKEASLENKPV